MTRDWIEWHAAYEDPASSLSQRRLAVTAMIRRALDETPLGRVNVLSLCAGEGRDVIDAAIDHPRAADVTGCLIELDPLLAERAQANAEASGLPLTVRRADAGRTDTFADLLPVDVLVLVGIFGNVSDDDIARTLISAPSLCTDGATIIWTRHRRPPDATPAIRRLLTDVGCEELNFVSAGPGGYAAGSARILPSALRTPLPEVLFRFL